MCQKTVRLEDAFIDLAFEQGPVPGMTPKEIKKYIRYIADWRLGQLGLKPIYMVDEHPLPWLAPLLNGVEHANFFETRATEYSKARDARAVERGLGLVRQAPEGEGRARGERGCRPVRAGICSRRRGLRRSEVSAVWTDGSIPRNLACLRRQKSQQDLPTYHAASRRVSPPICDGEL